MLFSALLVILHLLSLPVFIFLLDKTSSKLAALFLVGLVSESILVAFYTLLNFGGAFGSGIILFCGVGLTLPVALLIFIAGLKVYRKRDDTPPRLYLVGGVLIILLQAAPFMGQAGIGAYCNGQIRQAGQPVIEALQAFQADRGSYPDDLALLIPDYLIELPQGQCLGDLGPTVDFDLIRCPDSDLLITDSFDGANILRYQLNTKTWSGVSFLDGPCNFLPDME